jgi:mannan endo-1,4-beta-mannosidase
MYIAVLWQLVLGVLLVSVAAAGPERSRRQSGAGIPSQFVTTQNGKFMVNGRSVNRHVIRAIQLIGHYSALRFVGTNAYWLHALNTDTDIDNTLASIAARGIKVVRTWAFNGTYLLSSFLFWLT